MKKEIVEKIIATYEANASLLKRNMLLNKEIDDMNTIIDVLIDSSHPRYKDAVKEVEKMRGYFYKKPLIGASQVLAEYEIPEWMKDFKIDGNESS